MPPRIAIVDDDQNILTSIGIALENEGFQWSKYTDGEQALKGLRTNPADLMILDIKMPRMDGMQLLSELRKDSSLLPVILLTSKDEEIDELLGLQSVSYTHLTLPPILLV